MILWQLNWRARFLELLEVRSFRFYVVYILMSVLFFPIHVCACDLSILFHWPSGWTFQHLLNHLISD